MTDYEERARLELLAEDAAAFQKRVEVRAAKLRAADQQQAEGTVNFPRDLAARKVRYDELVIRLTALLARRGWNRSVAEDAEIAQLWGHIFELGKNAGPPIAPS